MRPTLRKLVVPTTISDLRRFPEFFDTVADRVWQAWWKPKGYPLEYISAQLRENTSDSNLPFALVAHERTKFLGTASAIVSDLAERPNLSPWVAAVWVEPQARRQGLGATLVGRTAEHCFALGFSRVYLCARPQLSSFYRRLGWIEIETGVGPQALIVFARDAHP